MATSDPRRELAVWLREGVLPEPPEDARKRLIEESIRQGLAGLLDAAVVESGSPWPADCRNALRQAHREQAARSVRQMDLAARLLDRLARAGLRALPLKGAAVADSVYRDGERPMADVDLLVLDDFASAVRVTQAAGARLRERGDHAWVFVEEASGLWLELHHAPTSCPGLFPLDAAGLWGRRVPGRSLSALPSPEDLLVLLSLHAAFQHGLALSLVQWYDFRKLQTRAPDVALASAIAAPMGGRPALYASLSAAAAVVGATSRADRDSAPLWLRAWLDARLRRPESAVIPSRPPLARLRLALTGGRRAALFAKTLRPAPAPGIDAFPSVSRDAA